MTTLGGFVPNPPERFRHREWTSSLRSAGVEHRRVNDCRHTFATWAIESGDVDLWYFAKIIDAYDARQQPLAEASADR